MDAPWFEIDRAGLAKIVARRGKAQLVAELCQNAWDAPGVTRVEIRLDPVEGRPLVRVRVEDDSPTGFSDLAHSFTLFAESIKKSDPTLRGRFNLGEKLVLSLCDEAAIASTTGTVTFGPEGRRVHPRRRRAAGTEFSATVRMTRAELEEAIAAVRSFIPPEGILTAVNGIALAPRPALRTFEHVLATEVADEEGTLRRVRRKARVALLRPLPGMPGRIYEMGIPLVETGDAFDVDVGQKVPLSMERDSVTPAYLRDVRVGVMNHAADLLDGETAAAPWVSDALNDAEAAPEAVRGVIAARYGDKAVIADPSDPEANHRAVSLGYVVVHGGAFNRAQWENVRASGALRPAGQVTPTPRPFSADGPPAEHVPPTPEMRAFAAFCKALGRRLLDREVSVSFLRRFNAAAAYGNGHLSFNVGRLGKAWFAGPLQARQLDLVLHEFGHETSRNHLDRAFSDALTRLGAGATMLALAEPGFFDLARYAEG